MKFIFTILSFGICLSVQAQSLQSNSAGAWVCRDSKNQISFIELVSFSEGKSNLNLNIISRSSDIKIQLADILKKLNTIGDRVFLSQLDVYVQRIMKNMDLRSTLLPVLDSDLFLQIPSNKTCSDGSISYEQIANATTFGGFTVNSELYNSLSHTQQAAVVFYGAIEKLLVDRGGIKEHPRTRQMVGYAFSDTDPTKYIGLFTAQKSFDDCPYAACTLTFEAEDSGSFHHGLAKVKVNGHYGFIDTKGQIAVPFIYDWAGDAGDDLIFVQNSRFTGYVDHTGKEAFQINERFGGTFANGVAVTGWDHLIDKSGKTIIESKGQILSFSEGFGAIAIKDPADPLGALVGYIDTTGKQIVALKFPFGNQFKNGSALVFENGKIRYIDTSGKDADLTGTDLLSQEKQATLNWANEGIATPTTGAVSTDAVKMGYFSSGGYRHFSDNSPIFRVKDRSYLTLVDYSEGIAAVYAGILGSTTTSKSWFFVDLLGNPINQMRYDAVGPFVRGLAPACLGKECIYILKNGSRANYLSFEQAYAFSEGFSLVKINAKRWGFVARDMIP